MLILAFGVVFGQACGFCCLDCIVCLVAFSGFCGFVGFSIVFLQVLLLCLVFAHCFWGVCRCCWGFRGMLLVG